MYKFEIKTKNKTEKTKIKIKSMNILKRSNSKNNPCRQGNSIQVGPVFHFFAFTGRKLKNRTVRNYIFGN